MTTPPETEIPSGTSREPSPESFVATVFGLGYMPFAPGTFGSLAGVGIYWAIVNFAFHNSLSDVVMHYSSRAGGLIPVPPWQYLLWINLSLVLFGLITSDRVCKKTGIKDPQFIVIDETSGQMLTYSLAFAPLNWKYLLLGFILFRLFDIWKPFPARQAESLPGGWGIMADDWVAGIYAALGLWIARAAGL
jgi:phosphatidylglycerophosphatase A